MKTEDILKFLHEAEKLKLEMRHSWMSNGRQESVAEHAWRLSLMVLLMGPRLDEKIDLSKALKIAVVHDLSEILVGDVPAFLEARKAHHHLERESMEKLKERYKDETMDELHDLWLEYEDHKTPEARFVKALDKLEVRIQHDEADIGTWNDLEYPRSQFIPDKYCEYDSFLKEFNDLVKAESRKKIKNESHRRLEDILEEAEKMKAQE